MEVIIGFFTSLFILIEFFFHATTVWVLKEVEIIDKVISEHLKQIIKLTFQPLQASAMEILQEFSPVAAKSTRLMAEID